MPSSQRGNSQQPQYPPSTSLALPPQPALTPPTAATAATAAAATAYANAYPQYPPYYSAAQYAAAGYKPGAVPTYPTYPSQVTAGTPGATQTPYNPQAAQTYSYAQQAQAYSSTPYVYPQHSGYLNSPVPGTPAAATPYTPGGGQYLFPGQGSTQLSKPLVNATGNATAQSAAIPAAGPATTGAKGQGKKGGTFKGAFTKDLRNMMYGFGDDVNPAPDTVNVMEEILMEYIADVCQTALKSTRKSTIKLEDLKRALSRPADAKKLARMEELLFMQEDIKRARAQFDPADESVAERMAAE